MSAATSEHDKPRGETEDLALETDLGWAIRMVSAAFSRVATESVSELPGGPRGYLVLVALAGGEPPTQLALAKEVSLDRTVMTYLLDDLEAHELITRSGVRVPRLPRPATAKGVLPRRCWRASAKRWVWASGGCGGDRAEHPCLVPQHGRTAMDSPCRRASPPGRW
ncbi:MarR family winged helix-turn-helix transcriptional regulator [Streptomyces sp. NPDC002763]|uniref:MarR family winged helix-turn-helix transcriptional regulator n=1 Tax=Streptomyces sp. NPDC002763 TaxID=3154427 RepID=UPI0033347E6B